MKKRLLAMALVLIMACTLLPVSALALEEPPDEEDIEELLNNGLLAGKRWIDVVFHTADVADAGTSNNVWLMIEYVDGDVWGDDPDEISYFNHDGSDFDRGATDSYKRLIPDKQIKGYTIAKKGDDDWYLHSVELDGYLYKFDQKLGKNARLNFSVGSYNERLRPLTVVFYTANYLNAGTDADVWMEIEYEDGIVYGHVDNHGHNHVETPLLDNDGDDFERGDIDSFTFSIPDKPVRKYIINMYTTADYGAWLLDQVEIDGVKYTGPGHSLYGTPSSFAIEPGITSPAQEIRFTVETGNWDGGGTDRDIEVTFYVQDPQNPTRVNKSPVYDLDNPGNDFEAGEKGTYELRGIPAGKILYCDFRFYEEWVHDHWDLESVSINGGTPVTVHHTFTYDEKYRVFLDAETIERDVDIYTGDNGTDASVYIKFSFADGTETLDIDLDNPGNDFEANSHSIYEMYLPDKDITEITFRNYGMDSWNLASFIFDGKHYIIDETLSHDKPFKVPYNFSNVEKIEKIIEIYTGNNGTDQDVRVKFKFTDGSETGFIDLDNPGNDFEANTYQPFTVNIPNKTIETIIIGLFDVKIIDDKWELNYFVFDGARYTSAKKTFKVGEEESFAYKGVGTASTFSDVNTGLIIGIGVPVIVIAAAAVVLVLRKKKKNSADTAE